MVKLELFIQCWTIHDDKARQHVHDRQNQCIQIPREEAARYQTERARVLRQV